MRDYTYMITSNKHIPCEGSLTPLSSKTCCVAFSINDLTIHLINPYMISVLIFDNELVNWIGQ